MRASWPSTARDRLARAGARALDLLYPPRCVFCAALIPAARADGLICAACRDRLVFAASPLCPRCGQPAGPSATSDRLCPRCRNERRYFRQARSILRYEEGVDRLVLDFKFRDHTHLRRFFGGLLREHFPFSDARYDRVVAVPLHPDRLRWRGYNQSLLLAREVASHLDLPVETTGFLRVKNTRPQVGLRGIERRTNVRGAFRAERRAEWDGARLLLVDDVFTSGSTASECAKVLRAAGVAAVDVLTLARAVPRREEDHRRDFCD